jgi:adenine-specific DNA-methyltransferase
MGLDEAHKLVHSLALDFNAHRSVYLAASYSESQLRTDFLNKFITAFGWDVDHVNQKNPFAQEVKVETNVSDSGSKRRADYAFYVTPNFREPRFFIEAKKPFGDLASRDNYFQAIRYGWNSHTPLVVLTNFYQTHLLDCRYKPDIDTCLDCAVRKYGLDQLGKPETFAELYYLISHEAAASNSLEKFAATLPKRRGKAVQLGLFKGGYQRMDLTFLTELDDDRKDLARTFRRTNPTLDGDALTEITQRVLDRLIFIRFLEDKLIEPNYLVANFGATGKTWADFVTACRRLDTVYNGIVFKRHNLIDAPEFNVDESAFGDVCERLAHVNSPYDFNAIPIYILGNIYERFLGNVIVVTPHGAKLEAKPEVRKAGGVYYTPEYIVRWLVKQTVGRAINGKSPQQIASMRFCDIACGSGSFLLGVFHTLMEEHVKWYNANPERAKRDGCILSNDGAWHLSLAQKRVILVNNIYGVDVDPQAVEVAQLSLYLKLLEEETISTAREHQLEFKETLLPSLARNIICGNSLIEPDLFDGVLLPPDEERHLRPMDIKAQFSKIMEEGGFDVIVGNPPYVRPHNLPPVQKEYFWTHYPAFKGKADIYACFIQRSTALLKPEGYLGYIVSQGWLTHDSFDVLRQHILQNYRVTQLVNLPKRVFEDAAVETIAFTFQREPKNTSRARHRIEIVKCEPGNADYEFRNLRTIPQSAFATTYLNVFDMSIEPETESIKRKMKRGPTIGSLYDIVFGLKTADDDKFLHHEKGKHKEDKPLLRGDDVRRYGYRYKGEFVWYVPKRMRAHRSTARPGEPFRFEQKKVLVKDTTTDFACTYEDGTYYVKDVLIIIPKPLVDAYDLKFVAGIINSKALRFYYRTTFKTLHVQNGELASLPLPNLDLKKEDARAAHDALVTMVDQILETVRRRLAAKTDSEASHYELRYAELDRRIDSFVADLYGLSHTDLQIIDEALEDEGPPKPIVREKQSVSEVSAN